MLQIQLDMLSKMACEATLTFPHTVIRIELRALHMPKLTLYRQVPLWSWFWSFEKKLSLCILDLLGALASPASAS